MKNFSLLLIMMYVTATEAATTYYVRTPELTDAELARSVRTLTGGAVRAGGGALVTTEAAAEFSLEPSLVHLGQSYLYTVTRFKGAASVNANTQKAASLDELDVAITRAVRAAIRNVPNDSDRRVGDVDPRDEDRLIRRTRAKRSRYFGLGPASYVNLGTRPLAYDLALGVNWEVSPHATLRVLGDLVTGDRWHSYFTSLMLGLNYYWSDEDNSPYVAGLVGFGSAGTHANVLDTVGGFAGTAGFGWTFFRTASTQLDLFAGYSLVFNANSIGAPSTYGVRVGLLF